MIPYDVIVTSASRPDLLKPTLESHLKMVDQPPRAFFVHDDAVFPGKAGAVDLILDDVVRERYPVMSTFNATPQRLGLALRWLLWHTQAEYVLYLQDDFFAVRPLPIAKALAVMDRYSLHSIRFNKRATMEVKDTWRGPWRKEEFSFRMRGEPQSYRCPDPDGGPFVPDPVIGDLGDCQSCGRLIGEHLKHTPDPADYDVLTISDHWGFQTALWRTSVIRAAVEFCCTPERIEKFRKGVAEDLINKVMDGEEGEVPGLEVPVGASDPCRPDIRVRYQKTFLWGPIGEDRYIRHIGGAAEAWAGTHRREAADPQADVKAWEEIREAQRKYGPPGQGGAD